MGLTFVCQKETCGNSSWIVPANIEINKAISPGRERYGGSVNRVKDYRETPTFHIDGIGVYTPIIGWPVFVRN
jgi:hypothetical protein